MDISSVLPGYNSKEVAPSSKPKVSTFADYRGPSFMETVARSAQIEITEGAGAALLQLKKDTEELYDEPFDFKAATEEMLDNYVVRIKKMLNELKDE